MSRIDFYRVRPAYFSIRFQLLGESVDYDVGANYDLFKSSNQGSSVNYSATKGSDDGTRYNIRIKPESNAIWVKFNNTDNDVIYIAGDEVLEYYNVPIYDLYVTSATATTAQVDQFVAAAESSGNYESSGVGTYFKLYARSATSGIETVYGVWFDTDNGSSQPEDSEVDVWVEIDVATSATADTVGGAVATALDALDDFGASNSTGTVTITHAANGARQNAVDINTPGTITTETEGDGNDTNVNILIS